MSRARKVMSVAASAVLLAACAAGEPRATRLSVYAASSLTEAFAELEAMFERAHPDADVAVTFAGSQVLRIQIEEGAPADVFASANPEHLHTLVDAGMLREGHVFAHNELVVIVPLDNPAGVDAFSELPDARRIVLGTADVPVGRYARQALARADSLVRPGFQSAVLSGLASEESNVRLARAKVELGEADAAIVYLTDAAGSDRIRSIPIPDSLNVQAEYLIGAIERPGRSELAEAWIELVLSADGRAVLERYGFLTE
jgi:molybdate transport system substrate-binding protein